MTSFWQKERCCDTSISEGPNGKHYSAIAMPGKAIVTPTHQTTTPSPSLRGPNKNPSTVTFLQQQSSRKKSTACGEKAFDCYKYIRRRQRAHRSKVTYLTESVWREERRRLMAVNLAVRLRLKQLFCTIVRFWEEKSKGVSRDDGELRPLLQ